MSFVDWDSSLDVSVGQMNEEHKTWINYINRLHESVEGDKTKAEIVNAYDRMYNYTIEHFTSEQNYLKKINYPLYDDHLAAHEEFLAEMRTAKTQVSAVGTLDAEFFAKLRGWLFRHIRIVDTQYGEFSKRMKKAS